MNIVNWNRPKQAIKRVILLVSYLLLLLSLFIAIFVFIWINNPGIIKQLDKKIPDFYSEKTMLLFNKATKESKSTKKLEANYKLLNYLDNISDYDKHIDKKIYAYRNIVNILNKNKQYEEALIYATQWNKELPNDIDSYILKVNVLKSIDVDKATLFLQKAYDKFFDIKELYDFYLQYFYERGDYSKIQVAQSKFKKHAIREPKFLIYFTTKKQPEFSQDKIIHIGNDKLRVDKSSYFINFNKNFEGLEKIRISISKNYTTEVIKGLSLNIKHNKTTFSKDLSDFTVAKAVKINSNDYALINDNPYFEIDLTNTLRNMRGNFIITFDILMQNSLNIFVKKAIQSQQYNAISFSDVNGTAFDHVLNSIYIDERTLSYSLDIKSKSLKVLNYEIENKDIYGYKSIFLKVDGVLLKKSQYQIAYINIQKNEFGFFEQKSKKAYVQFKFLTSLNVNKIEIVLSGDTL